MSRRSATTRTPTERAKRGWVTRLTRKLHELLGGEWVVWCPESSYPITKRFRTRSQAKAVSIKMAEEHLGQHFIVCELHDVACMVSEDDANKLQIPPTVSAFLLGMPDSELNRRYVDTTAIAEGIIDHTAAVPKRPANRQRRG